MSTPTNIRWIRARDIAAGDRLYVAPFHEGSPIQPTPWAGPIIVRAESTNTQTNIWTENGGQRSFAPGDVIAVCDVAEHCDHCAQTIYPTLAGTWTTSYEWADAGYCPGTIVRHAVGGQS